MSTPLPQASMQRIAGLFHQAQQLHAKHDRLPTDEVCRQILALMPDHQGALQIRAEVLREMGRYDEADAHLTRLTALAGKENIDVRYEWGVLRYYQGRAAEAEGILRALVRQMPDHAFGHMVLGRILEKQGAIGAALFHLTRAHELRLEDETICKDLATLYHRSGEYERAVKFARLAWNLNPDYVDALLAWGRIEEGHGNLEKAAEITRHARLLAPENPLVVLLDALLKRRMGKPEEAVALLDGIDMDTLFRESQASVEQERGHCLEKLGRYDEAFAAFSRMAELNRMPPLGRLYPEELSRKEFAEANALWRAADVAALPRATVSEDEPQPVFVLGFPRSGTTLVEQIITMHPEVIAGDETHALDVALGRRLGSSSSVTLDALTKPLFSDTNGVGVQRLRHAYLQQIRRLAILEPGYRRFTDKTPLNETHIGLIHCAFPDAPMVHLIRHPLNVVLSSFINDVRHGRNFATRLETTALHYSLVMELVETQIEKLTPRYLRLRYEDLVADFEPNARKLIDFLGLAWNDRCLEFHTNERRARTASYSQVTEKLYTRSVDRYKHFQKHLEPVIPILEPWITKLGYEI